MLFGIGLPKSGTRSLHDALCTLGYHGSHHNVDWRHELSKLHPEYTVRKPNAQRHIILPSPKPVAALKDIMPKAKFIYTVRDREGWLNSATNNWRPRSPSTSAHKPKAILRDLDWHEFLGTLDPTPEQLEQIWFEWNDHVDNLFKDEPDRLLVINICAGDGWAKLCKFLNYIPIPQTPFPYIGKAT